MRDTEIADRLRDRNPWWRHARGWQERDQNLREAAAAPFEYRPGVLQDLRAGGLYTLSGPRRVGKSLEVRRAIEGLIDSGVPGRNILYSSCDGFSLQDLRRLFRAGESLTRGIHGTRWWFLDEVTAVGPGWSSVVKDSARRYAAAQRLRRPDGVELPRAAGGDQELRRASRRGRRAFRPAADARPLP